MALGAVTKREFERVIVDFTVQEKAIAFPSDSRLLEVAREKIARLARRAGIRLKLTHEREGKSLRRRAAGYARAKQFKRLKKVLRRQRTILGSLLREVRRKMVGRGRVGARCARGLAATRRALARAARARQEQAVRAARTGGGVHRQRQGAVSVRVRRQGQRGGHAPPRADLMLHSSGWTIKALKSALIMSTPNRCLERSPFWWSMCRPCTALSTLDHPHRLELELQRLPRSR